MKGSELNWIVRKASELLSDKIEDGPLDEDDIELAYSIFAKPRLVKSLNSFRDKEEYYETVDCVKKKLHEVAQELNAKYWPDEGS